MKIIGLLGAAASGKSEAANHLVSKYGAVRYSFAGPLKEIVRRSFDLSDVQVYGTQVSKEAVDDRYNVSPRWLLQRIGTEGIRNVFGEDFWWEYLMGQILSDQPELAVIDDFRFVNETEGFLTLNDGVLGTRVVDIWRMEPPANAEMTSSADPGHQSEAEWMKCPHTVLVKPKVWGLVEFFDELDRAAFESGLVPAVRALR